MPGGRPLPACRGCARLGTSVPHPNSAHPGLGGHPGWLAALVWTSQHRDICIHFVILNEVPLRNFSFSSIKICSSASGQTHFSNAVSQHFLRPLYLGKSKCKLQLHFSSPEDALWQNQGCYAEPRKWNISNYPHELQRKPPYYLKKPYTHEQCAPD